MVVDGGSRILSDGLWWLMVADYVAVNSRPKRVDHDHADLVGDATILNHQLFSLPNKCQETTRNDVKATFLDIFFWLTKSYESFNHQ